MARNLAVGLLQLTMLWAATMAVYHSQVSADVARRSNLSRSMQKRIDNLFYHFTQEDSRAVIELFRKSLAREGIEGVQTANAYLRRAGKPSLDEMLTRSRMKLLRNASRDLPVPLPLESELVAEELRRMLVASMRELRSIGIMADPMPDPRDFYGYRDLLWEVHVQQNERQNAVELAKHGQQLITRARSKRSASRKDEALVAGQSDFSQEQESLSQFEKALADRSLELRIARLRYATEVLAQPKVDTKQRMFAAYAIGVDKQDVLQQLNAGHGDFSRQALNEPDLANTVAQLIAEGERSAGTLVDKSRHLFAGLHWWRRGRYGLGTEAFGLFKSQAATRNPRLQFALHMPKVSQVPTEPEANGQRVPLYDRRHHYSWGFEDRRFYRSSGVSAVSQSSRITGTRALNPGEHFDGFIGGSFW